MRKFPTRIFAALLVLVLALSLTACGGITFQIDEKGLVTWDPVPNAVKYECAMVDRAYSNDGNFFLEEPSFQLEPGHSLHVRPVFEDGSTGDWYVSDYYGESAYDTLMGEDGSFDPADYPNINYDLRWEELQTFELISAIRWDTVRTDETGLLTFEADGPHGTMRFEGEGVTAENGTLTFQPDARIWALDAIGRICAMKPIVADPGDLSNSFIFSGGYTFSDATAVNSHEELMYVWGLSITTGDALGDIEPTELMDFQPNFIIFGSFNQSPDAFSISGLEVYYDETAFTTGIRHMGLETNFYGTYLTGDRYDPSREVYDLDAGILNFYLCVWPELQNELVSYDPTQDPESLGRSIIAFTPEQFETGDLRRADGTVVDRTASLEPGMTMDVTVGDHTYPVALPVNDPFAGAVNLNQLVPYGYPAATGEMNAILVPVAWQDQPENANEENLFALKGEVGRVIENGTVTDYSEYLPSNTRFSLSEYFDMASYGKLNISTFVTDWFIAPFDYSEYRNAGIEDEAFREALYTWLMETYPDMDWTPYDKDGNGYFDAVMFVNVGKLDVNEYYPWAFSGGAHHLTTYNGGRAGTPEKPTFNGYINVNADLLAHNTLIHEFGHNLGLIDYYDVTYTGIDAVGGFDMQSGNIGDWNPYSKYAAGWTAPMVVDLQPGESAEYTIGAFEKTGDAIVIPVHADTFDGPFNEYILVDLFTDGGVNVHDAAEFGLENVHGVRIYHIDARMETHIEEVNGITYPLGTPRSVNAYNPGGIYQVELIQAGRDNTFTDLENLRTNLSQEDLFRAGMTFSVDAYSEFFRDGKMNDGSDFPYVIEVVSVSATEAVIRVTAQ